VAGLDARGRWGDVMVRSGIVARETPEDATKLVDQRRTGSLRDVIDWLVVCRARCDVYSNNGTGRHRSRVSPAMAGRTGSTDPREA